MTSSADIGARPFASVLVANRGEIALRVLRGCRDAGLATVAVFSDPDEAAPHVAYADRAFRLGPAPSSESYLAIDRVLEAADRTGADAIHPGYGFLAENAAFAEAVVSAGSTWIGPPPGAIRTMGEKTAARRAMEAAGVPVIPGTLDPVSDLETARAEAGRAGYPVLLKAAAGGGGKGMRVVRSADGIERAFDAARREAMRAFGDPAVYVERYLPRARHVEIQVVADVEGRTIHLGERECSLQRRHQKILEEAPAPGVDTSIREEMGAVAVRAARAVGYVGVGTVEFLLAPDGSFYFLEMNTRLQVEHPVTEAVTGHDLVGLQLAVAAGRPLPITQKEVRLRGHAIECRITAEDPAAGFLPATGTVERYREPAGPGVRFDSGIARGLPVTTHYDPLLAKLVVWGSTREEALDRAARALDETRIVGVETNLAFQRALIDDPAVRSAEIHTTWLEENAPGIVARAEAARAPDEPLAAALAAWGSGSSRDRTVPSPTVRPPSSRWRHESPFVWIP